MLATVLLATVLLCNCEFAGAGGLECSNTKIAVYVKNQEFHFALYNALPQPVFMAMIESLWLQFGPFMRMVVGRWGTSQVVDQHEQAIRAIRRRDAAALKASIEADIMDGMGIIGEQALQSVAGIRRKV